MGQLLRCLVHFGSKLRLKLIRNCLNLLLSELTLVLHARYIEFVELFLDPRYLIDFQEEVALLVEVPVG